MYNTDYDYVPFVLVTLVDLDDVSDDSSGKLETENGDNWKFKVGES